MAESADVSEVLDITTFAPANIDDMSCIGQWRSSGDRKPVRGHISQLHFGANGCSLNAR